MIIIMIIIIIIIIISYLEKRRTPDKMSLEIHCA